MNNNIFQHWPVPGRCAALLLIASLAIFKVAAQTPVQINVLPYDPFCAYQSSSCEGDVSLFFAVSTSCVQGLTSMNVTIDGAPAAGLLSGSSPNYQIHGIFAVGGHTFVIQLSDACGNTAQHDGAFEVVDCAAPSISWQTGFAVTIAPITPADVDGDGDLEYIGAAVYAADFLAAPPADCTVPLSYSIYAVNEVLDSTVVPQAGEHSLIWVECDQYVVFVRVFAWDNANNPYAVQPDGSLGGPNYAYQDNYIIVQQNEADCLDGPFDGGSIAGRLSIAGQPDAGLEGAHILLSGGSTASVYSDSTGYYGLQLFGGGVYTITPQYDAEPLYGVSSFDNVLITKHILGVQSLDSPYKRIAADVNNSGTITTQDVISLRRLILHQDADFANNTSWRFVPASYVFPDPDNPWLEDFPEYISIECQPCNLPNLDFIAIKIGDVNGSAGSN